MTQETLYTSQTPIQPDVQDGDTAYTLGSRFTTDVNASCVGARFFEALTPPSGNVTATLWTNAGVKLAENAFVAPVAGGWNTVTWTTPVNLTAGTPYVISYFTQNRYVRSAGLIPFGNGSHLSTSAGFFHGEASGVAPVFPTDDSGGAAYFADVIIDVAAPAVTGSFAITGTGAVTFTGEKLAFDTVAVSGTGTFTVIGERGPDVTLQTYKFGPCDDWPVIWGRCNLTTASPTITGQAVQAASELLYMLTAQRFDTCTVKLRPCRAECAPDFMVNGFWFDYGVWPKPALINGTWYNLTCGLCSGSCGCTFISETLLPGPVASVVDVKVNGISLVNGVDYRVDDYRKLVRLGGNVWPFCNDFNLADTELNTWSVTAVYGEPVPVLGQLALGELACEFVKFLTGGQCALPYGITDINRQGVSMSFADAQELLASGFLNLPICDQFIRASNPNQLQARSKVYDIDGPEFRAVGTA